MLTAEVLAFTTSVDRQVAARTPPVRVFISVLIWSLRRNTSSPKLNQLTSALCDSSA